MKLLLAPFLLAASASAFTPSVQPFGVMRQTTASGSSLANARIDSAEAVKDALKASKEFGPTSKEARIAWDIVEEMDASDNSAAFSGKAEEVDPNYEEKVAALQAILEEQKGKVETLKNLASEIQAIKLSAPPATVAGPDSEAMKKALEEAKEATEKHGSDSKEAILAWETVEEVASSDNSAATMITLDEECLVETIEACEALEEISRVVNMSKGGGSRYSG